MRFFKALVLVSLVPLLGLAVARFGQPPTLEIQEPAAVQTLHCVQAFTAGLLDGHVAAAGELSFCRPTPMRRKPGCIGWRQARGRTSPNC